MTGMLTAGGLMMIMLPSPPASPLRLPSPRERVIQRNQLQASKLDMQAEELAQEEIPAPRASAATGRPLRRMSINEYASYIGTYSPDIDAGDARNGSDSKEGGSRDDAGRGAATETLHDSKWRGVKPQCEDYSHVFKRNSAPPFVPTCATYNKAAPPFASALRARAVDPASQSHFGTDGWDRGEGELWRASGEALDGVLQEIMEIDRVASDLQTKLSKRGADRRNRDPSGQPFPAAQDQNVVQEGHCGGRGLRTQLIGTGASRPTTVDGSSSPRRMPPPRAVRPHSSGNESALSRRIGLASLATSLQDPQIWNWRQDAPKASSSAPTPVLLDTFSVSFGNRMRQVSTQESRDSVSMRRERGRTPIALRDSHYQQLGTTMKCTLGTSLGATVVTQGLRRDKARPGGFEGETRDEAIARLAIASPRDRYFSSAEQTAAIAAAAEAETLAATARARPSPFAYRHDTLQVLHWLVLCRLTCLIDDLIVCFKCSCMGSEISLADCHLPPFNLKQ